MEAYIRPDLTTNVSYELDIERFVPIVGTTATKDNNNRRTCSLFLHHISTDSVSPHAAFHFTLAFETSQTAAVEASETSGRT